MNILIQYLLTLKNEANYNIEKYVPESVNQRSMAYLQDSFDIHNIFTSLFEKRSNDSSIIASYKDSRGNFNDTDWTLSAVVKRLRGSDEFKAMTKRMQNSKEMRADSMKKFFETNALYKKHVFYNSSTKQKTLQGFRLKVDEDDVRVFRNTPYIPYIPDDTL